MADVVSPNEGRYLQAMLGRDGGTPMATSMPYSPRSRAHSPARGNAARHSSPGTDGRGSSGSLHSASGRYKHSGSSVRGEPRASSPPRIALQPAAPLVSGRALAELPAPSWPPQLDFRYLGYGDAGPYAGDMGGGEDDVAFRFDGFEDHSYAPGPPIAGGGFVFGFAPVPENAPYGTHPRSRNRLRLASGGGGLDGGSDVIHPDSDPYAPDDTPGTRVSA
ncbi:hypothetical protein T492DRAFT_277318 [Pavlovales sp. CCMP2436]|nr:hypothetical protein T492DRAFT_277318 [Pavlovales sp. CCMP2436]